MSDLEQLGRQFRRRRQEQGATQAEVAAHVGVTRQWLVRVEAGTGNPDLRQLLRLCEVLDTSLSVTPRRGLREVSSATPVRRRRPDPSGAVEVRVQPQGAPRTVVAKPSRAPTPSRRGNSGGLTADLDALLSSHTRANR